MIIAQHPLRGRRIYKTHFTVAVAAEWRTRRDNNKRKSNQNHVNKKRNVSTLPNDWAAKLPPRRTKTKEKKMSNKKRKKKKEIQSKQTHKKRSNPKTEQNKHKYKKMWRRGKKWIMIKRNGNEKAPQCRDGSSACNKLKAACSKQMRS